MGITRHCVHTQKSYRTNFIMLQSTVIHCNWHFNWCTVKTFMRNQCVHCNPYVIKLKGNSFDQIHHESPHLAPLPFCPCPSLSSFPPPPFPCNPHFEFCHVLSCPLVYFPPAPFPLPFPPCLPPPSQPFRFPPLTSGLFAFPISPVNLFY